MRWFHVGTQYGRNDYEDLLYTSIVYRQIQLPQIRGEISRRFSTLRVPIPPTVNNLRWRGKASPTCKEYEEFVARVVALAPHHAAEIRSLPPGSEVGHLMIERIGPACPEIQPLGASYTVRESLKKQLECVSGIEFFPSYLSKVVPLEWELGQPMPKNYQRIVHQGEPERYILDGNHSPELAQKVGAFYEVILPPPRRWRLPTESNRSTDSLRVTFHGFLPRRRIPGTKKGTVLIEVNQEQWLEYPWFRVLSSDEELFGNYIFVREDVYEILREPGRWTLEFKEIEML